MERRTGKQGNLLVTIFDMDEGKQVAAQTISKEAIAQAVNIGGITICTEIGVPESRSKVLSTVKEGASEVVDGVQITGKAVVVKAGHAVKGIARGFGALAEGIKMVGNNIVEGAKQAACEYDTNRLEKALQDKHKAEEKVGEKAEKAEHCGVHPT